MAQILDGTDQGPCGADKFIKLFVVHATETPKPADPPQAPQEKTPEEQQTKESTDFRLFKQHYTMRFGQKGIIYSRLDQRLLKKKSREGKATSPHLS